MGLTRTAPGADAVALVGIGALFPGATSAPRYWENVAAGVDAITEVPPDRWEDVFYDPGAEAPDRVYCRRGGFVDTTAAFDPTAFGIMPVTVESAEPDQLLALRVATEAIDDTVGGMPAGDRVGVVVGRGGYFTPGMARFDQRVRVAEQLAQTLHDLAPELAPERIQEVKAAFQDRLGPVRPEGAIDLVPNLAASRIANRLDLQGPAYTLDAACASSLLAVDHAVRDLREGRVDAVVAGGVHHCHDVAFWAVFSQLRALSPSEQIRPFDRSADGLLIGEGTGMVVLKRLADAERDGDRVYAVVRGTGTASDGKGSSVMVPRVDGQLLALERAWRDAGLDPATIGLVEAHGTATPTGDEAELTTLGRFFGPAERGEPPAVVGSVKSMIGHAMPAAGMAGLIKTALAVHHRVLPPTLHCEEPHPAFAATRFRPLPAAEPWEEAGPAGVRRAAVNAFGFGGINAHVVLEAAPGSDGAAAAVPSSTLGGVAGGPVEQDHGVVAAVAEHPSPGDRVVRLAAGSVAELAGLLQRVELDDPTTLPPVPDGAPVRLALVAPDERRLGLARRVVERGTAWRGRNDVWFSGEEGLLAGGGRVAYVFPGVEPSFAPQADDVAVLLGHEPIDVEGSHLGRQGAGIVALGRLLHEALDELGLRPDLLAGHSIGEWNAMIASGMLAPEGVDEFIASVDLDAIEVPDVVFAALGCSAQVAQQAIVGLDGVAVSHDNCPHQSVVCGREDAVQVALDRLRDQKVLGQVLPFRSGFHSPMLEPYLEPARRDAARVPLARPTLPVWSATTVAPYPHHLDEVRDLVIRHLVEPVRFRELTEHLYDDGVRAFVQVGVGSLTGFLDDTLKDVPVLTVSAGSEDRPGLDQLRRVAAALWVEGAEPRFEVLDPPAPHRRDDAARPHPRAGAGIDVPLGAPLVRLDGVHLDLAPAGSAGGAGTPGEEAAALLADPAVATSAVGAELGAALREAAAAGRAVADAWRAGPSSPAGAPAPTPAPAPRRNVEHHARQARAGDTDLGGGGEGEGEGERVTTRVMSLEAHPYLVDHAFNRQAPGWTDQSDRFPIVPMTMTLELLREAAVDLVPGRLPVAVEDVRALRWLPVEPPTEVTVSARRVDEDHVRVSIEGYSRGTVVLADAWPEAPAPDDAPLGERAPQGPDARAVYDDGWLFHGPEYRGIREIGPLGPGGMTARIECLPAPGAVLDAAGQLVGHWLAVRAERDRLALPRHLGAVRWYGPLPEPGTPLDVTMRVRDLSDEAIRGDLDLVRDDGTLWCRIDGWEDHRFQTDDLTWAVAQEPERRGTAEPQPGGWVLVRERWQNTASRELSMRRYLARAERDEYDAMNPNAQRQWLLGRIAAKDAARTWQWDRGAGPIFPAEVQVLNDEAGQPRLRGTVPEGLRVSLAHTRWLAVAVVGHEPVGIDIERVEPRTARFDGLVLSDEERAVLPGELDDTWRARVWTAKEAVAKAAGTGLEGNPRRFVLDTVDGERLRVDGRWVRTTLLDLGEPDVAYVVAVTETETPPESEGPSPA